MEIYFYSQDTDYASYDAELINALIKSIFISENLQGGNINVIFTSVSSIVSLNKQYLNREYSTDIITFDYSDNKLISGDLFISIPVVQSNAEIYNVQFEEELVRIIIHGILHLCGYKDSTNSEKELMRAKEDDFLNSYKSIV